MSVHICTCRSPGWHAAGEPCKGGGDGSGGGVSLRALVFGALFSLPIWLTAVGLLLLASR